MIEKKDPIADGNVEASANDNGDAIQEAPVVVMIPKGRPEHTYARFGNLLLPMRFAQRMEGWTRPPSNRSSRTATSRDRGRRR